MVVRRSVGMLKSLLQRKKLCYKQLRRELARGAPVTQSRNSPAKGVREYTKDKKRGDVRDLKNGKSTRKSTATRNAQEKSQRRRKCS